MPHAAPTSIAGDVTLQPSVPAAGIAANDPAGLLLGALEVRVATSDAAFACDVSAFSGVAGAPTVIADGPLATTGGSATQALDAAAGSTQFYCFEVALPDPLVPAPGAAIEDYMGVSIAPAWEFTAES